MHTTGCIFQVSTSSHSYKNGSSWLKNIYKHKYKLFFHSTEAVESTSDSVFQKSFWFSVPVMYWTKTGMELVIGLCGQWKTIPHYFVPCEFSGCYTEHVNAIPVERPDVWVLLWFLARPRKTGDVKWALWALWALNQLISGCPWTCFSPNRIVTWISN